MSRPSRRPPDSHWARWRERRRARAQQRREADYYYRRDSANENRLRAEADLSSDDRRRAYAKLFDSGGS